ncbi:MAG TPA: hypothetical protein VL854_01215 [Nitrososphaeraceae archaeon]|nr:hypothetical protein [Nitrososphaeraceae archaeon]
MKIEDMMKIEPTHMKNDKTRQHLMLFQLKTVIQYDLTDPPRWLPADEYADAGNWCTVHRGSYRKKLPKVIEMYEKQGFTLVN